MEEIHQHIKKATGLKEDISALKNLEAEIDRIKKEINQLATREAEVQQTPTKTGVYTKKLEKVQFEIRKQEVLEMPLTKVEDISAVSGLLTEKQLVGKVFEYFSKIYREEEMRFVLGETKVKTECIILDLEYNALIHLSRIKFADDLPLLVAPVRESITNLIVSSGKVLAELTPRYLVIFSYALSKKAPVEEAAIRREVLARVDKSAVLGERQKLYACLSKLEIYEEVLVALRKAVGKNLLRTSEAVLEKYNSEVFYGTVYYLEDVDKWLCDNLVSQMAQGSPVLELPGYDEQREIKERSQDFAEGSLTIEKTLGQSLKKQEVRMVSGEMYRIIKTVKMAGKTKRSSSEKVKEKVVEHLHDHFKKAPPTTGAAALRSGALRLADVKVFHGMMMVIRDEKRSKESLLEEIGRIDETFFLDALEESFSELIALSNHKSVDFLSGNANSQVVSVISAFTAVVEELFTANFQAHLKSELFNALCSRFYSILVSEDVYEQPLGKWVPVLDTLLDLAKEQEAMVYYYQKLQTIASIFPYHEKAASFLSAYSEEAFDLPEEHLIHLVQYVFEDERVSDTIIAHIEKGHKRE
ncbi:hypothetical protein NEDG_00604 [Nematocida displodere]|uniref:Uncharacterized protein n=1 Tax=Nematocida displodere TaxID=1805483 RepID=A0A177ED68_9MICR|nr:hypothetical protein NEDG_00604 [Nematocida displodere]